jgi:1,2-diacylglycerol 3-alpha-glucosyltransferase
MKILMLCEFYNETLEYQENLLVKYYRKYGHEVTVITSTYESVFDYYNNIHDNKLPQKIFYDFGAKIIKLPFKFNILGKLKKYVSIKSIVEEEQPDLLYVHDIMPNMFEMLDYKKKNPHVKMIMDYHADYSNSANGWISLNILHKVIRKKVYLDPIKNHIERFYPIIPGSLKFLNEVYNILPSEMEILPLGADIDLVAEIRNSNTRETLRLKHNIKPTDKVIITGGKFNPARQTEIVIEAFKELNDENLHLLIIGDADNKNQEYKNQLLELSKNIKNIVFLGWLNNRGVYEYFATSDLAVFPASQSIIWQQAIASGLPLIVGDVGEQSLEYLNEFNAIVEFSKKNINAENFKKAIEQIIYNEENFKVMKEACHKTTAKLLDWNHLINNTLKFNS